MAPLHSEEAWLAFVAHMRDLLFTPTPCAGIQPVGATGGWRYSHPPPLPRRTPVGQTCTLESLMPHEAHKDPLLRAAVFKQFVDGGYHGRVVSIDEDVYTRERFYLVAYEDGDKEHMTEAEVRQIVVRRASVPSTFVGASAAPGGMRVGTVAAASATAFLSAVAAEQTSTSSTSLRLGTGAPTPAPLPTYQSNRFGVAWAAPASPLGTRAAATVAAVLSMVAWRSSQCLECTIGELSSSSGSFEIGESLRDAGNSDQMQPVRAVGVRASEFGFKEEPAATMPPTVAKAWLEGSATDLTTSFESTWKHERFAELAPSDSVEWTWSRFEDTWNREPFAGLDPIERDHIDMTSPSLVALLVLSVAAYRAWRRYTQRPAQDHRCEVAPFMSPQPVESPLPAQALSPVRSPGVPFPPPGTPLCPSAHRGSAPSPAGPVELPVAPEGLLVAERTPLKQLVLEETGTVPPMTLKRPGRSAGALRPRNGDLVPLEEKGRVASLAVRRPGSVAGAPQIRNEDPGLPEARFRYPSGLEQLRSMGIKDSDYSRTVLTMCHGDVQRAVAELLPHCT